MSEKAECPYCGEDVEINHDDGYGNDEDEIFQQECSECGELIVLDWEDGREDEP